MKTVASTGQTSPSQTSQRVKVGMVGLAAVVLLIGLASAIFSLANRDRATSPVIAQKAELAANPALANAATQASPNEPLAELGVAPTVDTNAAAPSDAQPQ